jgi:hypothetical protein
MSKWQESGFEYRRLPAVEPLSQHAWQSWRDTELLGVCTDRCEDDRLGQPRPRHLDRPPRGPANAAQELLQKSLASLGRNFIEARAVAGAKQ